MNELLPKDGYNNYHYLSIINKAIHVQTNYVGIFDKYVIKKIPWNPGLGIVCYVLHQMSSG